MLFKERERGRGGGGIRALFEVKGDEIRKKDGGRLIKSQLIAPQQTKARAKEAI